MVISLLCINNVIISMPCGVQLRRRVTCPTFESLNCACTALSSTVLSCTVFQPSVAPCYAVLCCTILYLFIILALDSFTFMLNVFYLCYFFFHVLICSEVLQVS